MTPGCYGVALEEQVRGIIIQEVRARVREPDQQ